MYDSHESSDCGPTVLIKFNNNVICIDLFGRFMTGACSSLVTNRFNLAKERFEKGHNMDFFPHCNAYFYRIQQSKKCNETILPRLRLDELNTSTN